MILDSTVRILIVDDHSFVRTGTRLALSKDGRYQVVAEARDGDEGLGMVSAHKPDLVTLDIQMPGIPLEEFISEALRLHPEIKILIVSSLHDEQTVKRIKNLPISGYLVKSESLRFLTQAVNAIIQGATWFSSCIATQLKTVH